MSNLFLQLSRSLRCERIFCKNPGVLRDKDRRLYLLAVVFLFYLPLVQDMPIELYLSIARLSAHYVGQINTKPCHFCFLLDHFLISITIASMALIKEYRTQVMLLKKQWPYFCRGFIFIVKPQRQPQVYLPADEFDKNMTLHPPHHFGHL